MINTFDIDGVIDMGEYDGVYPGQHDIIITGRSFEEAPETYQMLARKGIFNQVFFNPLLFSEKTRISSGLHKAETITHLIEDGLKHGVHFEDDEVQIEQILKYNPSIRVVHVSHGLVEKENVRRK